MSFTVEVKGLHGVEEAMREAGPKLARRALRKALRAGGKVMLDEVRQRTPVAVEGTPQATPGELKRAMTMKVVMNNKGGEVIIGARYRKSEGRQSPGVYDLMVEFGSVHNKQPKPHLRPGFDASNKKALAQFTEVIREELENLPK